MEEALEPRGKCSEGVLLLVLGDVRTVSVAEGIDTAARHYDTYVATHLGRGTIKKFMPVTLRANGIDLNRMALVDIASDSLPIWSADVYSAFLPTMFSRVRN